MSEIDPAPFRLSEVPTAADVVFNGVRVGHWHRTATDTFYWTDIRNRSNTTKTAQEAYSRVCEAAQVWLSEMAVAFAAETPAAPVEPRPEAGE
jgi:hypothetical protein